MEQDMAGLFQVLYGKGDGTFRKAEVLNGTDGKPLIIPTKDPDQITEKICTRPFAVDWDGDGHLDLIVGNFSGTFYWFKGEGKGRFRPSPELLKAGEAPLRITSAHSDPFVIDWDGDGDLDVLSGSSDGGVYWAENVAGKGKVPELRPFRPLIEPGPPHMDGQISSEKDLTRPMHAARIWVDDFNGDGKLDLLVGDSVTLVSPAPGVTVEEFKKRFVAWKQDFKAAAEALNGATNETREKMVQQYNEVYGRRAEFMNEEMTGFVWLYLQK
jgi:hypothetical protein